MPDFFALFFPSISRSALKISLLSSGLMPPGLTTPLATDTAVTGHWPNQSSTMRTSGERSEPSCWRNWWSTRIITSSLHQWQWKRLFRTQPLEYKTSLLQLVKITSWMCGPWGTLWPTPSDAPSFTTKQNFPSPFSPPNTHQTKTPPISYVLSAKNS